MAIPEGLVHPARIHTILSAMPATLNQIESNKPADEDKDRSEGESHLERRWMKSGTNSFNYLIQRIHLLFVTLL
jgi:hypothetical protein